MENDMIIDVIIIITTSILMAMIVIVTVTIIIIILTGCGFMPPAPVECTAEMGFSSIFQCALWFYI